MRRLLAGAALAALALVALAADVTEPIAVPTLSGRVVDLAGTLTAAERDDIAGRLQAFEQAKGAQIAVLLVPSIGPEPIEDFALRVTDSWKLGRAGVDDGVLFVIAKQERKIRIQTGRGVQGVLTDALSKRIIAERVSPLFRTGDFHGGILVGVESIMKAIEGEALPPPAQKAGKRVDAVSSYENFFWLVFFVVPVVGMVLRSILGRSLGAAFTSGATGLAAWLLFGSVIFGGLAALIAFVLVLFAGAPGAGGRPGGGWMSGGWTHGGGGSWSGGGGFSGGGGGFDGGGASGSW
jgi:uncharacterized protein